MGCKGGLGQQPRPAQQAGVAAGEAGRAALNKRAIRQDTCAPSQLAAPHLDIGGCQAKALLGNVQEHGHHVVQAALQRRRQHKAGRKALWARVVMLCWLV